MNIIVLAKQGLYSHNPHLHIADTSYLIHNPISSFNFTVRKMNNNEISFCITGPQPLFYYVASATQGSIVLFAPERGKKYRASTRRALQILRGYSHSDHPRQLPPSSLFSSRLAFMQSLPLHFLDSKSLPAARGRVSDHCPRICHANAVPLLCQASGMLLLPLAQRSLEIREYFEGILKTVFWPFS